MELTRGDCPRSFVKSWHRLAATRFVPYQLDLRVISSLLRRVIPERFRPIGYLTHLVRERTNNTVRCGPFAGMRYVENSIGSAYLPKLLGTYERELTHVIEAVCADRVGLIIVLGAAEGYYAIGLALRNPQARVAAFEREEKGRVALAKMARVNGVQERVEILGECRPAELETALRAGTRPCFVLCDVEGEEDQLLDLQAVPSLRRTWVLVETHEFVRAGISNELQRRFASTHKIMCIWQETRSAKDFPFETTATRLLPISYLDWAVSEWRPTQMSWLWMQPRE
jgi:hypothetical protein